MKIYKMKLKAKGKKAILSDVETKTKISINMRTQICIQN